MASASFTSSAGGAARSKVCATSSAICAVGYEGDQTRKHRGNLPLLRRQVKAEPDNLFNWHHLYRVLAGLGRERQSERVLLHAVKLARAKPFIDPNGVLAYCDLIAIRNDRGEDVTELLAEARGKYPRNCVLAWQEARALMAAGRYDEAIADWDWLLAVDVRRLPDEGPAYDERLFGELAHEGRGLCLFRLGRYEEAAAAYAAAAECAPEEPAYPVKRKLALARARRQQEALSRRDVRGGYVLILTPMKNASTFLDTYFAALSKLSYPPELISLGFLESDSRDDTYELIVREAARLSERYRRVGAWKRDFGFEIPEGMPRWSPELQSERRAALARSRYHRDGLVFPPFFYGRRSPLIRDNNFFSVRPGEIETEGLGVLASDMGYECWGMPNLEILHHPYD